MKLGGLGHQRERKDTGWEEKGGEVGKWYKIRLGGWQGPGQAGA